MQDLALRIYQLPEWLTVERMRVECAEAAREVELPLTEAASIPEIECATTITIDFGLMRP